MADHVKEKIAAEFTELLPMLRARLNITQQDRYQRNQGLAAKALRLIFTPKVINNVSSTQWRAVLLA